MVCHFKNKDFSVYQNLIELFKNLRDGNINPKEVSKNLINCQSDLGETKKGNTKSRSEDQISVIRNVDIFFLFKRKNYSFLLSEATYKVKYGRGLKILTNKQMLTKSTCTSKSR